MSPYGSYNLNSLSPTEVEPPLLKFSKATLWVFLPHLAIIPAQPLSQHNLHAVIEEESDDDEGQINGHSLQADGFESEDDLELAAHLDSDSDGLDEHITRGLAVEDLITEDFECEFAESGVYH